MDEKPHVPKHLTAKTRRWFLQIVSEYDDLPPQDLLLLQAAGEAWDRAQQARELLAKDGMTFTDRHGAIRPHPATQIERDNKTLFRQMIRELALSVDGEPDDSRPPAITGKAALKNGKV